MWYVKISIKFFIFENLKPLGSRFRALSINERLGRLVPLEVRAVFFSSFYIFSLCLLLRCLSFRCLLRFTLPCKYVPIFHCCVNTKST
jgi:hypothetical protein